MIKLFGWINICVLGFNAIFIIIAIGLDHWLHFDGNHVKIHAGIWNMCTTNKTALTSEACGSVSGDSDYNAVRALLITALVLVCVAVGCILIKLYWLKERKIVLYVTAAIQLLAGLFLMVGFALYRSRIFGTVKESYPYIALHAGFGFCIIAWVTSWTAVGITVVMLFVRELE